ncbi:PREDICTED: FBD-associated F-box protein At3g49020-like [Camelina sativa]|uniref:FBD-associated F-box protein At3g49020-like n=1 Tax=Camelina sativa TaxID=90675 RepID=A0ABM1RS98_CAMSA|nr:PREDICTED: FBD-associated F-box protein At3g49020-like [Camelina sativa]
MEQQQHRKIGGEDRISELPECLLLYILSLLPTEIAIATSVLSKRWRSLWKVLPNLKFIDSSYNQYDHKFSENLCRSLILHKAPVLESLHLEVGHKYDAFELGLWIGIAFSRHVRKLVLDFQFDEEGFAHFSRDLGRCHNTLEVLELKYNILIHLRLPVCFESLTELNLYLVEFEDEESVSNLFLWLPLSRSFGRA